MERLKWAGWSGGLIFLCHARSRAGIWFCDIRIPAFAGMTSSKAFVLRTPRLLSLSNTKITEDDIEQIFDIDAASDAA